VTSTSDIFNPNPSIHMQPFFTPSPGRPAGRVCHPEKGKIHDRDTRNRRKPAGQIEG
jgi:hypothetical protein